MCLLKKEEEKKKLKTKKRKKDDEKIRPTLSRQLSNHSVKNSCGYSSIWLSFSSWCGVFYRVWFWFVGLFLLVSSRHDTLEWSFGLKSWLNLQLHRSHDNLVGLQSKKKRSCLSWVWNTFIWIWFQNKINFSYLFDNLIYRILKKNKHHWISWAMVLFYCIATIDSTLYIPWCDIVHK